MVTELEKYLTVNISTHLNVLKSYLLAASDKDQNLLFMESCQEATLPNPDIVNCEFLKDAGIFVEDPKPPRKARNRNRVFHLTEVGKQFAKELRLEESTPRKSQSLINKL